MRPSLKALAATMFLALTAAASHVVLRGDTAPRPGVDWPQFRGIRAAGVAEGFTLPSSWSVADGKGVAWKTSIPGLGHSSPVVWGDALFLTSAISGQKDAGLKVGLYGDITPVKDDTTHEWRVYCLDKKTGAIKWQQTAYPVSRRSSGT